MEKGVEKWKKETNTSNDERQGKDKGESDAVYRDREKRWFTEDLVGHMGIKTSGDSKYINMHLHTHKQLEMASVQK